MNCITDVDSSPRLQFKDKSTTDETLKTEVRLLVSSFLFQIRKLDNWIITQLMNLNS